MDCSELQNLSSSRQEDACVRDGLPVETGNQMVIWHHQVHEYVFGESLAYFQLQFVPVYRRDRISERIRRILDDSKVASYCVYEIFGLYDIMLRVWLPSGLPGPRLVSALYEALKELGCARVLPFFVNETMHHWPWSSNGSVQTAAPARNDLNKLKPEHIHLACRGDGQQLLEEFNGKHLLRVIKSSPSGIKLFVTVPPPPAAVTPPKEVENLIIGRILNMLLREKRYKEPSVYSGSGFAWMLIKAKIQSSDFPLIDQLINSINELGVEGYSVRTYTYLCTGSVAPYSEELEGFSHPVQTPISQVQEFFQKGESGTIEIKGTARLDLSRHLNDPQHPLKASDDVTESALKTIAAFLNSRGGTLVVGALEKSKFGHLYSRANSPLADAPTINDYIGVGINAEYAICKTKDFDGYKQMITDLVKTHIGSDAAALLAIERGQIGNRDFAIIRVPRGLRWYYLGEKFYVRTNVSSERLEGQGREIYQQRQL